MKACLALSALVLFGCGHEAATLLPGATVMGVTAPRPVRLVSQATRDMNGKLSGLNGNGIWADVLIRRWRRRG